MGIICDFWWDDDVRGYQSHFVKLDALNVNVNLTKEQLKDKIEEILSAYKDNKDKIEEILDAYKDEYDMSFFLKEQGYDISEFLLYLRRNGIRAKMLEADVEIKLWEI